MSTYKTDTSIILDTNDTRNQWCVYEHLAQLQPNTPPEVVYINASRVQDAYRLVDARRNSEWDKLFGLGSRVLVRITHLTDNQPEARRIAMEQIRKSPTPPRCNMRGHSTSGASKPVRCSNGETYPSQNKAASVLGLSASAVSRHMSGDLAHVKGYTFTFVGGAEQ